MKIILASQSPRRRELLSMITNNFEVIVSNAEEIMDQELTNEEQVKHLAYLKAKAVFDKTAEIGDRVVIGSDTIVVKSGKIFGKPKNYQDAKNMLNELNHDTHEVLTGLCVMIQKGNDIIEKIDIGKAKVSISNMSELEIEDWIATNEAYDKAGGYAIQGKFGVYIEKIEGDYYSIVGLPVHQLYEMMKEYLKDS